MKLNKLIVTTFVLSLACPTHRVLCDEWASNHFETEQSDSYSQVFRPAVTLPYSGSAIYAGRCS
jgi:hypothetical protein